MKIIKGKRDSVKFGSLKGGDVFQVETDKFWIKITQTTDRINAANLKNGDITYFPDTIDVFPIECELVFY